MKRGNTYVVLVPRVMLSETKHPAESLAKSQREILAFPLRASDLKAHCVQDDPIAESPYP